MLRWWALELSPKVAGKDRKGPALSPAHVRVVPGEQRKSKLNRKMGVKIEKQMLSASVYFCERKVFYHIVHIVLLQEEPV